mmetsp:Transcript_67881/g.190138  ORF Transcript_67881/g.190138 Transcript_67881/m.190138 type:complete len:242 (+) Transcript_67881:278-1003(+)
MLQRVMESTDTTNSMHGSAKKSRKLVGFPKRPQTMNTMSETTNGPCFGGTTVDTKKPHPEAAKDVKRNGKKKSQKGTKGCRMMKYTAVKTKVCTRRSKLFTLNLDKKNASLEIPLALSRQNIVWSLAKTCKQKMDIKSDKAVCKLSNAMPLHRGVASKNRSKMASTTAPKPSATRNNARWSFILHHCTNRLRKRMRNCWWNPGVSRDNPSNGSKGCVRIEPSRGGLLSSESSRSICSPSSD